MQAGSAPCTPLEVAYAPSRPPPGPKAVLCRRLAACSTQVRAEPSAAAGSEFLAGVVWKHRLCRCWSDLCILHSAFARWARRNGHGATSGRAPRPVLRHKPVPAPGRPQAGGTVRASDLGGLGGEATQAGERGRQPAARRPTAPSGTPPRRGAGAAARRKKAHRAKRAAARRKSRGMGAAPPDEAAARYTRANRGCAASPTGASLPCSCRYSTRAAIAWAVISGGGGRRRSA
jgi:hypothetical protein